MGRHPGIERGIVVAEHPDQPLRAGRAAIGVLLQDVVVAVIGLDPVALGQGATVADHGAQILVAIVGREAPAEGTVRQPVRLQRAALAHRRPGGARPGAVQFAAEAAIARGARCARLQRELDVGEEIRVSAPREPMLPSACPPSPPGPADQFAKERCRDTTLFGTIQLDNASKFCAAGNRRARHAPAKLSLWPA